MGLYYVSLCQCFCVITKITIFRTSAGQLLAGWNASSRPNVCKVVFLGCRCVLPLHPFSFPWYLLTLSLLLHSSTLFLPWPPLPSATCGLSSWFLTPYLIPPHGSSFPNPLPTPCASYIYEWLGFSLILFLLPFPLGFLPWFYCPLALFSKPLFIFS